MGTDRRCTFGCCGPPRPIRRSLGRCRSSPTHAMHSAVTAARACTDARNCGRNTSALQIVRGGTAPRSALRTAPTVTYKDSERLHWWRPWGGAGRREQRLVGPQARARCVGWWGWGLASHSGGSTSAQHSILSIATRSLHGAPRRRLPTVSYLLAFRGRLRRLTLPPPLTTPYLIASAVPPHSLARRR